MSQFIRRYPNSVRISTYSCMIRPGLPFLFRPRFLLCLELVLAVDTEPGFFYMEHELDA
ncbi:MAG: hypothetical protein WHX93_00460 [bacterium]